MSYPNTYVPLPTPTVKTVTNEISSYYIAKVEVVPDTSAFISIQLQDSTQTFVGNMTMLMQGDDYQKWTTDDYLYSWIQQQIYLAYPVPQ